MNSWNIRKEAFLNRLKRELEMGRVDYDILDTLNLINKLKDFYTTSSCSGRIQLAVLQFPGEKFKIKNIVKWHRIIGVEELKKYIDIKYKYLWLFVQSPIIHIVARNLDDAILMLKLARDAGFKHSGILAIKNERITIEVIGSEHLDIPIVWNYKLMINLNELESLVRIINELLTKSKIKLKRLNNLIKNTFL